MADRSTKALFAQAQAGHQGDRAALLAAINDAAASLGQKKSGPSSVATTQSNLLKEARVNQTVARDLVSHATSGRGADMADFANPNMTSQQFEHGKTLLNNRQATDTQSRQVEEDLRSLRSEFDYGSKRKFLDVLGNVSPAAKLNRLRAQHEIEKAGSSAALTSYKSLTTQKSKMSRLSKQSKAVMARNSPTETQAAGSVSDEELEARPEDFVSCNCCLRALTEDEKIINARFVNEAMSASQDISIFPICISCNFANLQAQQQAVKGESNKFSEHVKEQKGVFFPSNKKLYDISMHQNSEEFKQLGTIHMENRAAEYYPLDKPSLKTKIPAPQKPALIKRATSQDVPASKVDNPENSRSAHVKNLMAERIKEEELRQKLITDEIVKMKSSGARGSSTTHRRNEILFPSTTNQECHNNDVHMTRPIDKTNFKKKNPFSAYVNSMFNAGVFTNPWQDGC